MQRDSSCLAVDLGCALVGTVVFLKRIDQHGPVCSMGARFVYRSGWTCHARSFVWSERIVERRTNARTVGAGVRGSWNRSFFPGGEGAAVFASTSSGTVFAWVADLPGAVKGGEEVS
jgi:hypothetical protein